ncbi:MAG TPA: alpha/beta fold hydrolase [Stellaceae bacterium]|nr:alpha/beta fold hydrolase [Stellaceae bacterium]
MHKLPWILAGLIVVVSGAVGGVLAFDAPVKPPPLASIGDAFANVDFSDLPAVQTYPARDGAKLGYRIYAGSGAQVVVLIHGSSDDGTGMHPLAKALRDAGASVYVPVLRGHRDSGRSGDIDYIGQLEDDLADFVAVLRPLHPTASFSLIGFSSGGGFALRVIAGPDEKLFDRFIMISPALPQSAPTIRPGTGGWVSLAMPRLIVLGTLNRIGVDWFNGLSIVAFATSPNAPNLTSVYSYRLAADFGAPRDYLAALGRSTKPAAVLVGGSDELFYPDRFAPLLGPARSDLHVTIVPGIGHIGMIAAAEGIAAVRKSFLALTPSGARSGSLSRRAR